MIADELRVYFNNTFGLGEWPKTYEVDAATYGYVCHDVFIRMAPQGIPVALGPNCGIMFKGVELILNDNPITQVHRN